MFLNTISRRITLFTLAVTMAIVLSLGILSYHFMRAGLLYQINQHIEHHAAMLTNRTENLLRDTLQDVRNMSENLIVVNALIDSHGREMYVSPFFQSHKIAGDIPFALTLCDFEGKTIISNRKESPSYRSDEYTEPLIEQESPLARITAGEGGQYLEMAYPVFYGSTGMAEGFLVLEVSFHDIMAMAMGHEPGPDMGHHVSVLSKDRTIWAGGEENGLKHVLIINMDLPAPLKELELSIRYIEGIESISKPLTRLSFYYLVAGLLSLALAYAASRTISEYISAPIESLSSLADETARTGIPAPGVGASKDSPDEVGVLARSLDIMLERLRESHDALDKKVRERTDELEKANTELKQEIAERKSTEERFRTVVTNAPIVFFRIDREGIFTLSEGRGLEALGLGPGEVVGQSVFDVYRDFPEIVENIRASLKGTPVRFTSNVGSLWFDTMSTPVLDAEGSVSEILGVATNITERKKAEDELHEANASLALSQFVLDNAGDSMFLSEPEAGLIYVNEAACGSLGYQREELLDMTISDIDPDYPREEWPSHWEELKRTGKMTFETRHRRKDGTVIPVEVTATYFRHGDQEYNVRFARNIAKRKEAEAEINRSLREKEVLLKEIHHRVKNNMAIISSLLNLQSRGISDEKVRDLFDESRGRIQTMALVHEQLYQSPDFLNIDSRDYVESLASRLSHTFVNGAVTVRVDIKIEDFILGLDQLIPVGLIFNELLTNCYKHAFEGRSEGKIQIELSKQNGSVKLSVRDNGVGLPDGFDLECSDTLGMRLIGTLTTQLGGKLEIKSEGGLEVSVVFDSEGNNVPGQNRKKPGS